MAKKIEKPWCVIVGSDGVVQRMGCVRGVFKKYSDIQYSENHWEPISWVSWSNKFLKKFKNFKGMVKMWAKSIKISYKEAMEKALVLFPDEALD